MTSDFPRISFALFVAACLTAPIFVARAQAPRCEAVDPATRAQRLRGRLVIAISKLSTPEPRMIIAPQGAAIFAVDLEQLPAGTAAAVAALAVGPAARA